MSYNYGDIIFVPSGNVPFSEIGSMRCGWPGPNPRAVGDFQQSVPNPTDYLLPFYSGLFHQQYININVSG
jgi:hypothetical protein